MTAPSVLAALGVVGGCELVLGLWALLLAPTTIIPSLGTNESHARPLLAHIGSLRIAVSLFLLSALLDVYESIATLVLAVGALNACVLQLAAASLYPIPHATPAKRLAAAALVEGFAALFGQCAAFGFAERAVIHAPAALLTVCSVGAAVPLALVAVNRRAAHHAVRTASPSTCPSALTARPPRSAKAKATLLASPLLTGFSAHHELSPASKRLLT